MSKICFVDFDDTLFSHSISAIPDSAVNAINTLYNKGIGVYICTGRNITEFSNFDISMIKIDGIIALNGQAIYDAHKNVIVEKFLNKQITDRLIKIFNEKRFSVVLSTTKGYYTNIVNDCLSKVESSISSPVPPIMKYSGEKIYMASFFCDNDEQNKELLSFEDVASITSWNDGGDVVSKNVSKGDAIKELIKILNIDLKDTIAIGDNYNDISMLETCAISIAMGNGEQEVKDVADYVTDDIDDDGLFNALKHFELI